jgi:hypothetical protein
LRDKSLSDQVVGALAKAIMDARRDLLGAYPLLAQISEPNTDKTDPDNDTYIPVHPGAAAYFGGDQKSFFDKYSDQLFYGSMLLGTVTSLFAGAWKFMSRTEEKPEDAALIRLYSLADRIGKADNEADLTDVGRHTDNILRGKSKNERSAAQTARRLRLSISRRTASSI